ncbi:MAG TPA: hypothetical protein VFQ12_10185 [Thermoleophilaceae bacterium]|nr:hypothetical protein [Thermoleophilaceae bacterium]
MTARGKTPRGPAALLAVMLAASLAACGDDEDFANDPRPPTPIELTGVIQDDRVTVSPDRIGAGPVAITIANQTDDPHPVILSGGSVDARIKLVAPTATTTIRRSLEPGRYEVAAGSVAAVPKEIEPAILEVGPERESSSGDVSLP